MLACEIASNAPTTSSCGTGSTLKVGYDGTNRYRVLLQISNLYNAIPQGAHVYDAELQLHSSSISPAGANATVQAYRVTRSWSNPTWNSATSGTAWTAAGGDIDTTTSKYLDPGYSNPFNASANYNFDTVAQLADDWYTGRLANYGILVKQQSETTNFVNTLAGASFQVVWTPNFGTPSAGSPLTRNLTDRLSLSVNATDGNPAVLGSLLSIGNVGPQLSLGYAVNGGNAYTTTSFDAYDLALKHPGQGPDLSMMYTTPDGQQQLFIRSGTTTYRSPDTINATLSLNTAGTTATLRFNDTKVTNTYSADGVYWYLQSTADTHGTQITYTYNTDQRLTGITDAQNHSISLGYATGTDNYPNTVTDNSLGLTATLTWDYSASPDRLVSVTDLAGKTTSFGYDGGTPYQHLTSVTDSDGHVTALTLSTPSTTIYSQIASVTFGSGTSAASTYSWAHPSFGTTKLTDPNGGVTTYTYNSAGQVTNTSDPLGHTTAGSWSPANKPQSRTDGLGQVTSYQYDSLNNLTKITSPAGSGTARSASYSYPTPTGSMSDYEPSSSKDAQGNNTSYSYNDSYQLATTTTPSNAGGTPTNHYQGDSGVSCTNAMAGELCNQVDGNGNTTSYGYDSSGNPTTINHPSPLGTVTFGYDAAGRQVSKTDGRGTTTYTTYDALDRITRVSSSSSTCPVASCISYTYNAEGWLSQRVDPSGTTSYSYDAQGRPLTKNTPTGNTSQTYDGNGNLASYTDAGGTVGYRYDAANRITAMWEPGGSCPTTPTYPNSTGCTGFGYDNANHRTSVSYPNGQTVSLAYDHSGRETSVTAKNQAGSTLNSRSYSYLAGAADSDLRRSVTDQAGTTTSYTYDAMNRLLSAGSQSWTYDHNGNRLTSVAGGSTTYSVFNGADELCNSATTSGSSCTAPNSGATSYTYNGSGDLTGGGALSSATFSTFDQVTSTTVSGTTTSNTYSDIASDERTGSGSTSFVNGILGVSRQVTGSTALSFVRDPQGNLIAARTSAGSYYYTADALGSTILVTDSSGASAAVYSYDSWGNTSSSSGSFAGTNPFRYAGGYTDATGFVKFGTRYYKPGSGTFTQQDPSGKESNAYVYASDNPINLTDPTGRYSLGDAWDDFTDTVGFIDDLTDPNTWADDQGDEALSQCGVWGGAGLLTGGPWGGVVGCGAGILSVYN